MTKAEGTQDFLQITPEVTSVADCLTVSAEDYHRLLAIKDVVVEAIESGDETSVRSALKAASELRESSIKRAKSYSTMADVYNDLVGKCLNEI
jgi:hypothetical protein